MAKGNSGTRVIRSTSGSKEYNRGVFENEVTMDDIISDSILERVGGKVYSWLNLFLLRKS